jgi:hypothetical protein
MVRMRRARLSLPPCACTGTAGLMAGLRSQARLRGGLSGSSVVSLKGGSCAHAPPGAQHPSLTPFSHQLLPDQLPAQ